MSKLVNYCISCMKLDFFFFKKFIIPHWRKFPCYSNTRDNKKSKTRIKDVIENNGVQKKTKYYTIYRWLIYKVKYKWKHQDLVLSLIKLSPSLCILIFQGVVGGVLIVTPNNIMFDPHKSDPLVIEHGCEEYGLICPMGEVVSVALYDDVSRMKLKDALPS